MPQISYYARGDNPNAGNSSLNVSNTNQVPTTQLTFEDFGPNGDLSFDLNGGNPDPDTVVYIGDGTSGTPVTFTVEFRGNLPNDSKLSNVGDPPNTVDLRGAEITVITLATGERFFFVTDPAFETIFAFDPSTPNGTAFDVMEDFPKGARKIDNLVVCFAAGTRIKTPQGCRTVEELSVGDQVVTETGFATIRLVSHRHVSAEEMCDNATLRPVVIPAHSLGKGVPKQDLTVTGTHRIKVSDPDLDRLFGLETAFVQARDLPQARPGPIGKTTLVHFLCDTHVVVDANGCPSESLFPGDMALMALTSEERAAYRAITNCDTPHMAHPCLTGQEAKVWRHCVQSREKRTDCVGVQKTSTREPVSVSVSSVTTPCS